MLRTQTMTTSIPEPARATDVQLRIWCEFRDMPGLRLTLEQTCRLCGLDSAGGTAALQGLVDAGVLRQVGPFYLRADLDAFVA
jgi:hypothetical protein